MSMFERMERKLERTVNGVFAKAFRSEVQPLELASAVRRAMDDRATMLGRGRTVVPNLFTIELSRGDFDRLTEFDEELEDELIAAAQEHAETQRYQPGGPLQVLFDADDSLETGVFRIRPATARQQVQRPAQVEEYREEYVEAEGADVDEYSGSWAAGDWDDQPDGSGGWEIEDPADRPTARREDLPAEVHHPASERLAPPAARAAPAPAAAAPAPPTASAPPRRASIDDRPWLEVDGERYPLLGAMTVLGRDDSADVVLDDPGISRRHCEVRITTDGPRLRTHLRDLSSTNGTFVNGEPVDSAALGDGDDITVGRTTVTYRVARR